MLSVNPNQIQAQSQFQDANLFLVIALILLSSLAGELYRADKQKTITKEILLRVVVRAFASAMVGSIALFYCIHQGMDIAMVGAITGGVSMIGADVVIAALTLIFKRKTGL